MIYRGAEALMTAWLNSIQIFAERKRVHRTELCLFRFESEFAGTAIKEKNCWAEFPKVTLTHEISERKLQTL